MVMRKIIYRSSLRNDAPFRIHILPLNSKRVIGLVGVITVLISVAIVGYLQRNVPKISTVVNQPLGISHEVSDRAQQSPLRLRIAKLSIDTLIEPVGIDIQGNMAVPQDTQGVSWYEPGGMPGKPGNVVLAGHFDDAKGNPAVFARLTTLTKGDKITITTMSGKVYSYTVESRAKYPYDKAPLSEIFGETDKEQLILITCAGKWDEETKNYSNREVIYARR